MITKLFTPSFDIIRELSSNGNYNVKGGPEYLDGRSVMIESEPRRFKLSFTLSDNDVKLYHNHIPKTDVTDFELISSTGFTLAIPDGATMLREFKDVGFPDSLAFNCAYSIDRLHVGKHSENPCFWRLVNPLPEKSKFSFYDFIHYWFEPDIKYKEAKFIKVLIQEKEYHFFHLRMETGDCFGVDSLSPMSYKEFQDAVLAMQTTYAFLTGNFYLDEAYYISSSSSEFNDDLAVSYMAMRESILSTYNMFTTNGSSVLASLREEQGIDWNEEIKEWTAKLPELDDKVFNALTSLFHENDSLSRAAFIILEANNLALELKAAAYCVAYEAICHTLKTRLTIETPSVIEKENWLQRVKPFFDDGLAQLFKQGKIDQNAHDILSRKVNNLNQPTNKDSLTAPFKHFNYELKDYEAKAIDDRNRFLHGSVPIKTNDLEIASQQLYFTALTIHKLSYILILKLAGFEGYIINYIKLHESMTRRQIDEDGFLFI
jgi:hypothetical protein